MNKIKIAVEYNHNGTIDYKYSEYDYCICIKDFKLSTHNYIWEPKKDKEVAYVGEVFKYVVKNNEYRVIIEEGESFYDMWLNLLNEKQFNQHFMNITEWRNKQLDNLGI